MLGISWMLRVNGDDGSRSATQRAGLASEVDVQAGMQGSTEKHSPSLEDIAY
jgi:hypothetical protein